MCVPEIMDTGAAIACSLGSSLTKSQTLRVYDLGRHDPNVNLPKCLG